MENQKLNCEVLLSLVEHYLNDVRYALLSRQSDEIKSDPFKSSVLDDSLMSNIMLSLRYLNDLHSVVCEDITGFKPFPLSSEK